MHNLPPASPARAKPLEALIYRENVKFRAHEGTTSPMRHGDEVKGESEDPAPVYTLVCIHTDFGSMLVILFVVVTSLAPHGSTQPYSFRSETGIVHGGCLPECKVDTQRLRKQLFSDEGKIAMDSSG